MNILVYGAGAVGGYLGGKLAAAGHQVTLITRSATAKVINDDGLLITEGGVTLCIPIRAVAQLAEALGVKPNFDLVIFGMKSYDLGAAVTALADLYPDAPCVMSTQNGIGLEQFIATRFGAERTLAGSVTIPISRAELNHLIVERTSRGLGIAPVQPGSDAGRWVDLFRVAGVRAGAATDYQAMKWSKAFLNIMGNASSAILNRPPAELYRLDAIFDLEMRMLRETLAVMRRLGLSVINLPGATARPLARSLSYAPRALLHIVFNQVISRGRGDKMPSFHIDLAADKERSEVVFHNGAIAAAGREAGIATPVNATLNDILTRMVQGSIQRETFDGRPDRLLEVVGRYERDEVIA